MKTKNMFRMLLVAALLLVGANGAKAEVLYDNPSGSGSYVACNFVFGTFDKAAIGDELRITYDILPQSGWTPTYQLQLGNVTTVTVTEGGTYVYTLDENFFQKINTTDPNNICTFITPIWTTIYKVELVSAGSSEEGNNGEEEETLNYEGTLLWSGNEDLGNWANNVSIPLGTFDNIKVGDELRFYGKLNDTTNPAYQFKLYGGQWGDLAHIVSSEFDGYVSVPVTADILAGLTMTDHWGYSGYFNGTNLTIKAITRVIPKEYVGLTIGSTGYATFSSTKALNLNSAKNLKFYYAKIIDTQASQVTMVQALGTVAANTGLVVVGSPAENVQIEVAEEGTAYDDNLLVAVSEDNTQVQGAGKYVLTYKNNKVMFAETIGDAATINAGKAYLQGAAAARAARLAIVFDGESTGIQSMATAVEPANNVVYNLRGQRVMNPGKGLYIINGKKIIK